MGAASYRVLMPLKSGGHRYAPGKTIDLPEKEAAALVRAGALSMLPSGGDPAKQEGEPAPDNPGKGGKK